MPAALVATVGNVPLKSKVFHSHSINEKVPGQSFQDRELFNLYFPSLPHEDPQAEVLGLLSPSAAPHAEGFGSLSPDPHEDGFGFPSPSFEPQDEPQPEEVMLSLPEVM
jgi:hypothetical protein